MTAIDRLVGMNLGAAMRDVGVSVEALADEMDVAPTLVRAWLSGDVRMRAIVLWEVTQVLDIRIQDVYADHVPPVCQRAMN